MDEQAVLVVFSCVNSSVDICSIDEELQRLTENQDLEYDGFDSSPDGTEGILYFYGDDAESMLLSVQELLEKLPGIRPLKATLRFGPANSDCEERLFYF